ncbi:probable ubiquitin conjugation factor E4 [Papaver somniferum]|uniref:probable ubiquitin conjugation factor E4 n=1 Tax=Papaver somniferum TaxID=3469 RepID=UPI000E6F4ED3|nr:probable ubiquitin conjugation factor E4 [Papaver somniferum]
MAKRKRYISADEEDRITRKIFEVTLRKSPEDEIPTLTTNEIFLEKTASKLVSENKSLNLCEDLMETVLIDRCFSGEFNDAEPAFTYLIGCYRRAFEQEKQINILMNKDLEHDMTSIVKREKSLAVSYCLMIYLVNSIRFPVNKVSSFNESPLVRLLFAKVSPRKNAGHSLDCPPGFFTDILEKMDISTLNLVLRSLYEDLSRLVLKESLLSDLFLQPLAALTYLIESPQGAKALVNHPMWLPKGANGLEIEKTSILGPFFHVSLISDDLSATNRSYANCLHDGLEKVLLLLLENADTRESVLQFIAELILKNSSMANIHVDKTCASLGMFVNLGAVMLRLFKNFFDTDTRSKDEIDVRYVIYGTRLNLSKSTSLHSSLDEVVAWIIRNNADAVKLISGRTSSLKTEHTFFCEWYFMTARVLHLGLIKSLSELELEYQEMEEIDPYSLKEMVGAASFPQRNLDAEQDLDEEFQFCWRKYCSYIYQVLLDKPLLQQALSFYQLMLTWLVDHVGGFRMPLPLTCPIEFACVPEHFVEDAIGLLIAVFKYSKLIGGEILPKMDEYMNFMMFMANPKYIRNSYIREQMVELLSLFVVRNPWA